MPENICRVGVFLVTSDNQIILCKKNGQLGAFDQEIDEKDTFSWAYHNILVKQTNLLITARDLRPVNGCSYDEKAVLVEGQKCHYYFVPQIDARQLKLLPGVEKVLYPSAPETGDASLYHPITKHMLESFHAPSHDTGLDGTIMYLSVAGKDFLAASKSNKQPLLAPAA